MPECESTLDMLSTYNRKQQRAQELPFGQRRYHVISAQSSLIPCSVFNLQDSHFSPAADIKGRGNRDEVIAVKSRPNRRYTHHKVCVC